MPGAENAGRFFATEQTKKKAPGIVTGRLVCYAALGSFLDGCRELQNLPALLLRHPLAHPFLEPHRNVKLNHLGHISSDPTTARFDFFLTAKRAII
jgi:hypothetical protein